MLRILRRTQFLIGNLLRWFKATYLRILGVKIGRNTMISLGAKIDSHRGRVVIGDNCHITYGCVILSHDGAMRQINPDKSGDGQVILGNNVFVGVNSVILPNVTVGDNSVIAAGAVVRSDVPPNVIVGGNPATIIKHIVRSEN